MLKNNSRELFDYYIMIYSEGIPYEYQQNAYSVSFIKLQPLLEKSSSTVEFFSIIQAAIAETYIIPWYESNTFKVLALSLAFFAVVLLVVHVVTSPHSYTNFDKPNQPSAVPEPSVGVAQPPTVEFPDDEIQVDPSDLSAAEEAARLKEICIRKLQEMEPSSLKDWEYLRKFSKNLHTELTQLPRGAADDALLEHIVTDVLNHTPSKNYLVDSAVEAWILHHQRSPTDQEVTALSETVMDSLKGVPITRESLWTAFESAASQIKTSATVEPAITPEVLDKALLDSSSTESIFKAYSVMESDLIYFDFFSVLFGFFLLTLVAYFLIVIFCYKR